jgi:uncharacterized SAM-binding protein YcdF (DUF218 family)
MFFILSKIIGIIIEPGNFLGLIILASTVLAFLRRMKLASAGLSVAAAIVVFLGILPGGVWLALPLEAHYPTNPPLPDRVAGVIVLGGTERPTPTAEWNQPTLSDPAPIAALVALGRQYPDARLIFTGGSGTLQRQPITEGEVVRRFLRWIAADPTRVIYEERSRNTHENATLTRDLIKPKPGERWILVTQAIAMPRAVAVFRQAGFDVIPYPAGYMTSGEPQEILSFALSGGLTTASAAMHEWIGLLVYRFLGYSNQVWPA